MLIFGFNHRKVKKYGPKKSYHCNSCSNIKNWELVEITFWFTLFFIPLIPYEKKYLLVCPVCNNSMSLTLEKFLKYKNDIIAPDTKNATNDDIYYGKTETQINYLKQMREFEEERERKNSQIT
jgi:zinc-ribbon family